MSQGQTSLERRNVLLVCSGTYHDFDYARAELLRRLLDQPQARTRVAEDYANLEAIRQADALITYTTDVVPTAEQQSELEQFLSRGGRWFALHGTNAIVEIDDQGYASSPRVSGEFMEMLGSQFIAHPPKGHFEVHNAQPEHPLVQDIDSFTVDDELYLVETHGELDVLLYANFNGKAMKGFTEREFFSDEPRPILYLKDHDPGQILYLTLGHCRGHLDMQPLMDWYPEVERCSWDSPVFDELLGRGIRWMLAA